MTFQVPHPILGPDEVANFINIWFNNWAAVQDYLNGINSSSPVYTLLGYGRIVEADITEGQTEMPPSPSLTVVLPEHSKGYIVQGQFVEIEEDTIMFDVPDDKLSGTYGYLKYEDGELSVDWFDTVQTLDQRPLIGKVFTEDGVVTSIDNTNDDYIQSPKYLRERLTQAEIDIAFLQGLVTGTGEPMLATNIKWSATNSNSIQQVVDAKNDAQDAEILRLSGGRTSIDMLLPGDIQVNTQAETLVGLGEIHPHVLDRTEAVVVIPNFHGDGTGGSPNYLGSGTLRKVGRKLVP